MRAQTVSRGLQTVSDLEGRAATAAVSPRLRSTFSPHAASNPRTCSLWPPPRPPAPFRANLRTRPPSSPPQRSPAKAPLSLSASTLPHNTITRSDRSGQQHERRPRRIPLARTRPASVHGRDMSRRSKHRTRLYLAFPAEVLLMVVVAQSEWCALSAGDRCCEALCPNAPITGQLMGCPSRSASRNADAGHVSHRPGDSHRVYGWNFGAFGEPRPRSKDSKC